MKLNSNTLKQITLAPNTLGDKLRLCGVRPYYAYENGARTENLLGYNYTVTCSAFAGDKQDVKIPGKALLGTADYDKLVKFTGLKLGIYPTFVPGQRGIDSLNIKATADSVSAIG